MRLALPLFLACVVAAGQSSVIHCPTATVGCAVPAGYTWTITKTAGNWVITGVAASTSQAAAGATSQAINVTTLSAGWFLPSAPTVKTAVACAGITAITVASIGVTGAASQIAAALTYDLKAAVSATNLLVPTLANLGPNTIASTTLTVTVSGAAQNISSITDGCSFSVSALVGVRP